MKRVAIPVEEDFISSHFGKASEFVFVDIEKDGIVKKERVPAPEHVPGRFPQWLKENEVNVLITSGIGPRAVELLTQSQIEIVYTQQNLPVEEIIKLYIDGKLEAKEVKNCEHNNRC